MHKRDYAWLPSVVNVLTKKQATELGRCEIWEDFDSHNRVSQLTTAELDSGGCPRTPGYATAPPADAHRTQTERCHGVRRVNRAAPCITSELEVYPGRVSTRISPSAAASASRSRITLNTAVTRSPKQGCPCRRYFHSPALSPGSTRRPGDSRTRRHQGLYAGRDRARCPAHPHSRHHRASHAGRSSSRPETYRTRSRRRCVDRGAPRGGASVRHGPVAAPGFRRRGRVA